MSPRLAARIQRLLCISLALCAGLAPRAQQPSQPTFRSGVHLIVQPVTVRDKGGKPVTGLTAQDFVVTEDGQRQEIAFVEYQALEAAAAGTPAMTPPLLPPVVQEAVTVPRPGDTRYRGRRLLILYFDLYRAQVGDQQRAFASAASYVAAAMTPADLVSVIVFNGRGVRVREPFTNDRQALQSVLQQLMTEADDEASEMAARWDPGGAFGEDDDTFNMFSADRQLAALQTAVTDLGTLPELKTLVYFGSGLRLAGTANLAQLRATINAAIRASVTLNPIDARGLVATPPLGDATRPSPGGIGMFSGALAEASTTRFQQSQDPLYALAKDTGGKALFDSNDLSRGIVQAADAVTGYYLVGYYSSNTTPDGRYRRVKVTLTGERDAELAYRAGYYADKVFARFNAADRERQLADALRLEDPITDIPMAMEVNYFKVSSAEYFVPVSVRMPGSELASGRTASASRVTIDLIGELKDEFGVTHRNVRDKIELPPTARSIQYETAFTVLPGHYVIKMVARNDSTGRIGTFQASFTVPDLERERLRMRTSSVVLSGQRVAAGATLYNVRQKIAQDVANPLVFEGRRLVPSVTRTFRASQPLFVFLEAYGPGDKDVAATHPLAAFVTLYRDGAVALETDPVGLDEWNAKTNTMPIRLTVPLQSLASGTYDCQVTVLDPGGMRAAFWRTAIAVVR